MTRATFDGPILSGDKKDGPLRNVGYAILRQTAILDVTAAAGAVGYAGASGLFVTPLSNSVGVNVPATLFAPSTSTFPPVANAPTADSATQFLRGVVFYLPVGSVIEDITVDVQTVLLSNGATPTYGAFISNNFAASGGTYGTLSLTNTAGTRSTASFSATQLPNMYSTPIDIPQQNTPSLSQLVVTLNFGAASGLTSLTTGRVFIAVAYSQTDPQIGSTTVYPYGNTV